MIAQKKILFVDDEPDIVKLVSFKLKTDGYDVIITPDGEEALNLMLNTKPDLSLLDLCLPGIDGYEVCRRIRADIGKNGIPIIFFTASRADLDTLAKKVKEAGGQDYIIKPFESDELLEKIKSYIG